MNSATSSALPEPAAAGPRTSIVFVGLLATGLLFTAYSLVADVNEAGGLVTPWMPYLLLFVALLIASWKRTAR